MSSFKKPKKNELYAGNSGTLARMVIALLSTQKNLKIKIYGDNSLNKRDMRRIFKPLSKIGCNFYPKNKTTLPINVEGTDMPLAQDHVENIGSAQVKSAIQEAMDHDGPVLIDFIVEQEENVYPMIPSGMTVADIIEEPINESVTV